jgi:hypothetical protein
MRSTLALFAVLVGLVSVNSALAQQGRLQEPLWQCSLDFEAEGGGLQFVVGYFELNGTGHIRCADIAGNTEIIPVAVSMGGNPIALRIAAGRFKMAGLATGIGIATEPESLLGDYYVANGQVAIGVGGGASLGMFARQNRAITLNVGLRLLRGTGLQIGLDKFSIRAR